MADEKELPNAYLSVGDIVEVDGTSFILLESVKKHSGTGLNSIRFMDYDAYLRVIETKDKRVHERARKVIEEMTRDDAPASDIVESLSRAGILLQGRDWDGN